MKGKTTKIKRQKVEAKEPVATEPASTFSSKPPGIITEGPDGKVGLRPFPDDLLEQADQEPDRIELADYYSTIVRLRQKGFTYREIAEWLVERGVDADHNAVYRVHRNNMSEEEIAEEAIAEENEKIH